MNSYEEYSTSFIQSIENKERTIYSTIKVICSEAEEIPINISIELFNETMLEYPKKYKVYLLNDNYTSMDFVVNILIKLFHKSFEQAEQIMLEIHKVGRAICGVYSHEIAETKVMQVLKHAKDSGFPLKATMEEE